MDATFRDLFGPYDCPKALVDEPAAFAHGVFDWVWLFIKWCGLSILVISTISFFAGARCPDCNEKRQQRTQSPPSETPQSEATQAAYDPVFEAEGEVERVHQEMEMDEMNTAAAANDEDEKQNHDVDGNNKDNEHYKDDKTNEDEDDYSTDDEDETTKPTFTPTSTTPSSTPPAPNHFAVPQRPTTDTNSTSRDRGDILPVRLWGHHYYNHRPRRSANVGTRTVWHTWDN
ncbi:hypothetical protein B0H63DRAFT_134556 [Podospora didyma]|uniref:Uncharacterized protein n=1 Tax=Podospora didyma TaxID=330526 RepID=A0AAE0P0U9_9PEZI|nr:hypothetical protein B0H63DRAFT_134556 [Podospora didyma]